MRLAPPVGDGVDVERERRRGWILLAIGAALLLVPMLLVDRSPSVFGVLDLFLPGPGKDFGTEMLLLPALQMIGLTVGILGVIRLVRYPARPPATDLARLRRRVADLERENQELRRSSDGRSS